MTPEEVKSRLALLKRANWPASEISALLGINLAEANSLLAQFRMWNAGSYEAAYDISLPLDHWKLDIFLNNRGWIPKRAAAFDLALTERCFLSVMQAAENKQLAASSETHGIFPGVYSSEFISGFYKRFPALSRTTFPTLDHFFIRLHQQIRETLEIEPEPVMCLTSEVLEDKHYANSVDAITNEPVSLPFQVFLDTQKPIQLRPDCCSWLTYSRFEDILRPVVLGQPPDWTPEQKNALEQYGDRS